MATGTRERILDAALDLFSDVGFEGTTISDVERRVGLAAGTGSFYRHFPSKEALLQAAVEHEVERCRSDIATARASLPEFDDSGEERRFLLHLALRDLRRFDRLFRLMLTEGERVPALRRAISTALQGPGEELVWEDDAATVVSLAALGGYHLFSIVQGRPFQDMPEDDFIAVLAALTERD